MTSTDDGEPPTNPYDVPTVGSSTAAYSGGWANAGEDIGTYVNEPTLGGCAIIPYEPFDPDLDAKVGLGKGEGAEQGGWVLLKKGTRKSKGEKKEKEG